MKAVFVSVLELRETDFLLNHPVEVPGVSESF